jgi:hypothetical protein
MEQNLRGYQPKGKHLEAFLSQVASNALNAIRAEGMGIRQRADLGYVIMATGRLLLRGVPKHLALEAIEIRDGSSARQMAEQVIDPIQRMLSNAVIQRENGEKVRIAIEPLEDYSPQDDNFNETRAVVNCMGLYQSGEYERCITEAEKALDTYQKPMLFHLWVLSLLRLGRQKEAEEVGYRALAVFEYVLWHNVLMAVILGKHDAREIVRKIDDEGQRCQLRFYEGSRLLAEGRTREAKLAFKECANSQSDLLERALAHMELQRL